MLRLFCCVCLSAEDCFEAAVHGGRQGRNKACYTEIDLWEIYESPAKARADLGSGLFFRLLLFFFIWSWCLLIGRSSKSHIYVWLIFPKVQRDSVWCKAGWFSGGHELGVLWGFKLARYLSVAVSEHCFCSRVSWALSICLFLSLAVLKLSHSLCTFLNPAKQDATLLTHTACDRLFTFTTDN